MKKIFSSIMTLAIALAFTACGGNSNDGGRKAQELSGAGATFPLPFYNVVFENFAQVNGDAVAYGGIGSGGGVRNLRDKIVDFAGSDAFLSDKEMAEMNPVIHVPTCMGAVVLAYNLDGVSELKLSGEVIADIFAGNIKMWNDERLAALNPDATLPAEAIIPVFRSDGSGTTFVFTDYLTKVSPMWASNFGAGKSVNFPSGQAAKGNPGVAGVIKQTKNSIGYVGSEYAFAQKIQYAKIQNLRGEFVLPSSATISAAASSRCWKMQEPMSSSREKGTYRETRSLRTTTGQMRHTAQPHTRKPAPGTVQEQDSQHSSRCMKVWKIRLQTELQERRKPSATERRRWQKSNGVLRFRREENTRSTYHIRLCQTARQQHITAFIILVASAISS